MIERKDYERRPRRRRRRVLVNINQVAPGGMGLSAGLGTGSLVVSALALLLCWVPVVGVVLGVLGVGLGLAGFIVAAVKGWNGVGLGLSIPGFVVGLLAVALGMYITVATAHALRRANEPDYLPNPQRVPRRF